MPGCVKSYFLIEELTEVHLLILRDIYDNSKSDHYLYKTAYEEILTERYADGDMQYLKLLIKQLENYFLLNYGSADVVINNVNQWHMVLK
jgi:hypothetical protein